MRSYIKLVFAFVIASFAITNSSAQTYYYEKVARVYNGVKQASSGDGHYLTFSGNKVYESNSSGGSLGYGALTYVRSDGGNSLYIGCPYTMLGAELQYVFNSDRSRLNIHISNNDIYVYERKSTVTNPRQYESIHVPSNNNGGSSRDGRGTGKKREKEVKSSRTCSNCHGTGDIVYHTGVSGYGVKSTDKYCSKCQKSVPHDHAHRTCPTCGGKGHI